MAQPFEERSSSGNKGDLSPAYRGYKSEDPWIAKDAVVARKKFSWAGGSSDGTDPSERPAHSTNGGCGLPAAAAPQQLSTSYYCTLELATTPGHSH